MLSDSTLIYDNVDLEALQRIAAELSSILRIGTVVALYGDLGVGKTQFAKLLINSVDKDLLNLNITSPTFNIVNIYNLSTIDIFHFDLYRIEKKSDLEQIGLEEMLGLGVSIIEWPEIAEYLFDDNVIKIRISHSGGDRRKIEVNF